MTTCVLAITANGITKTLRQGKQVQARVCLATAKDIVPQT